MELAFNDLESLIRNAFVPQVLVVTTPEVEEACMKNKCQFIDFLHPYTSLETNITVKGIKEEPYIIQDFRIRFLEPSELRLTHELEETIEQNLSDQVKDNITNKNQKLRYGECRVTNSEEASNFLSQCKTREQSDYLLPWFHDYQNKFLQNIGVSEHEYFSHPVACIFVVTSHEDNSIEETPESFIKIYDSVLQMPGLFKEGFMDNNFLRYHILLKDGHSENENKRAELKLASLRQAFGANTCMLTINSHPINKPNIENNIISFLSNEDQIGFQSFTREFITKFIIPHIERKVQSLDEIVSANRRGLFGSRIKNLFRGFGGGGAKSKAVEAPEINSYGAKIYSLSHPVSQMRQLADFVFFLRDYDNALVNYKNCLNDYKNDKSMKHWAGSLEMISICNSLLDIQRKESENDLEKVITTYFQENQYRFSTRVSFILVTMKKSRNRYLEAAAVCTRPENNRPISPLLSALFQEQAAFCYLYKQPFPMYRMFTMRLAIAADKYYQSGQYEHALGCTLAAYPNYQGKDWCLINSHLQYGIGRESYLLQDLPLSVDHFEQLLTQRNPNLKLSPEIQSTYLREFLHVLKNASDNLIKDVPIPSIKKGSVQVSLNSHYSQQGIWKQMEDWLVYESPREQARETFRNFSIPNNSNYTKHYASVVGERIYVWCEVENPLEVPLQLYSAQIVCDHFDPSDEMNADGSPVTFEQKPDFVLVEPKDIFLQPNTIYKLSLCIQPTKIGLLEIRSLAFNISGIVWGKVNFPIKTKKLHKTKEQRVNNLIETDYSLCIQVVSPMPLLEVSFPSLGPDLYHGEVKKFKISFKNIGEVALTNLKVKISHPSFFVFGPNEYLDLPFPLFSIDAKEKGTRQEIDGTYDLSLVHLPVGILKPKQSVDLILWVRGAIVGSVVSKFLFYYEPINIDQFTEMKYRVHKETSQFNVLPLFKSSILVNPSLKHINSYIFALEMQNTQPNLSLDITQISSVSSSWFIQPFNSFHSVQIQGSESVTIYSLVSMTTPHPGILLHTNTPIGKSNEKLIDSAAMPNYQFLVRSRRPHNLPTNTNFTYLNDDPPPPISSLVNINDSDFLIFWKTSNGNHHGFMDLQDISFLPIPPPPPPLPVSVKGRSKISRHALELKIALKSKARVTVIPSLLQQKLALSIRNPIRYLIDSPVNVFHDFADDFFCIVPIIVCVANPSQVNPITFKIEPVDEKSVKLENNDQSLSSSSTVTSSKSPFFWVGITSQTVQNLEPGKEFHIPIRVGFLAPGIYNINRFRFSLFVNPHPDDKGNETEAKQIFYPFEHLITIHSKGESITM